MSLVRFSPTLKLANADALHKAVRAGLLATVIMSVLLPPSAQKAYADPAGAIDTDGPDFVESSEAVGKGRFQFEAGPALQRDRRGGADQTSYANPLLLKFGLSDAIEARLETDSASRVSGPPEGGGSGAARTGFADGALGLKWHAQDRNIQTGSPAVAWLLHLELPSGTPELRGHGARPSLRAVMTWEFPRDFSLGVMPGIKYDTLPDGHRYASGILGVVLSHWWTPRFRTFIEGSAPQIAGAADGGVVLYDDIGAAWLITPRWQVGARAGWAANRNTPSRYVLLSVAARFP